MCEHNSQAPASPCQHSSRRRRIWEMAGNAHCPIIGVCMPMPLLRKLVGKAVKGSVLADDYELHCGVIGECRQRSKVAELLQKELETRYAVAIRQTAAAKNTAALHDWWKQHQHGNDIPGALWATLSHSRCDAELEERVLRDIHMIQHQVGATERVDLAEHRELVKEHGVLLRELGAVQERVTRIMNEKAALQDSLSSALMQLRSSVISKDTLIASLQAQLAALQQAVPDLASRQALQQQLNEQRARTTQLQRQWLQAEQQNRALEARLHQLAGTTPHEVAPQGIPHTTVIPLHPEWPAEHLKDKSILCVGGRTGSVPIYRKLVEQAGAQFLHHDGGEEDNSAQLDANLAAADLVICQTGCVSHNAYWRVKDHCKRTGKRCVFVDKPSASSLARSLAQAGHLAD